MPNNENIIFSGFESNFVQSFINGEEKRYVKDILKKLPNANIKIIEFLSNMKDIEQVIILANYSFEYNLYDTINLKYEYMQDYKSIDKNNNLYILHNDVLIPVYQIRGLDNSCFYILNINKMGKFCRDKDTDFFDIQVFEYSSDTQHLQEAMNKKINGCELEGDEKRKHLLESVNLVIREYVKFEDNEVKGYKLFYNNTKQKIK